VGPRRAATKTNASNARASTSGGGDAGEGEREDGGRQVGDGKAARGRVLYSHGERQERDEGVTAARPEVLAGDTCDYRRHRAQSDLCGGRDTQLPAPVGAEAAESPGGRNTSSPSS